MGSSLTDIVDPSNNAAVERSSQAKGFSMSMASGANTAATATGENAPKKKGKSYRYYAAMRSP